MLLFVKLFVKFSFNDLFCAGYMLCEMVVRYMIYERKQIYIFLCMVDRQKKNNFNGEIFKLSMNISQQFKILRCAKCILIAGR